MTIVIDSLFNRNYTSEGYILTQYNFEMKKTVIVKINIQIIYNNIFILAIQREK